MKRILMTLAMAVAVACLGFAAVNAEEKAADKAAKAAKAEPTSKSMTVAGEVVDLGCYIAHAASGEKHIECATKCIAGGMPMGLLTAKGELYLLTLSHTNADPFNKLKEWAGHQVKVTGTAADRAGMKMLEVAAAESPTAQATAPAK
jgi:hypothetical protein